MVNAMNEKIVTYSSANAEDKRRWVAYVDLGDDYLGIRFEGHTEGEARTKAEEFWAKDAEKREMARQNRLAGAEKARIAKLAKRQPVNVE